MPLNPGKVTRGGPEPGGTGGGDGVPDPGTARGTAGGATGAVPGGAYRGSARVGIRPLVGLGILQLLLFAGAAAGALGGGLPFPTLPLLVTAFLVSVAATRFLPDGRPGSPPERPLLPWIWGFALLFRVILLPLDPVLSDDVWRYLWDGVVQQGGINPFLHPPSAPELEALRTPWHPLINNPDVPTIYPGAAQLTFLAVALAGGGLLLLKTVLVAAELGAAALLYTVARRLGAPPARTLILVLWSPLAVVETAWSGHVDSLGLLFLVLALAAATTPGGKGALAAATPLGERRALVAATLPGGKGALAAATPLGGRRALVAGGALALAAMVKVAPAAALPPFLRYLGWRAGAGFGLAALLVMLPYLGAGPRLLTGLFTYAEHWRFNEALFGVLEALVPGPRAPRFLAGVLVLAVVAGVTWKRFPPDRALLWILGTGLLLSPTLHPWYLLWILPLAALRGNRGWLLATGTILLAYWGLGAYQRTGVWPHPDGLRLLIWAPPLLLLGMEGIRGLRRRPANPLQDPRDPTPQPPHGKQEEEGE